MAKIYETREAAREACEMYGTTACNRAADAITLAQAGEAGRAWNRADEAQMNAEAAMKAHDDLWELSKHRLTKKEREAFELAELGEGKAIKAAQACMAAVEKIQAEYDAKRKGVRA